MKLITEYLPNTTEMLVEDDSSGNKKLYIHGIFAESAKKNRNGRLYPTEILESAVNKYIEEEIKTNSAIGELNHPENPIPNPAKASHRIVELRKDGTDFYGKALVLDTPMGNIVRGLWEGGVRLGVSTRGLGTVKKVNNVNEVQDNYVLKTVDVVHKPSAINAFVDGIMEGVEYLVDGTVIDPETVEEIEDSIKTAPQGKLHEVKVAAFIKAMQSLNEANMECLECGHKFKKAKPTANTRCPKCGGVDIDLAKPGRKQPVNNRFRGRK